MVLTATNECVTVLIAFSLCVRQKKYFLRAQLFIVVKAKAVFKAQKASTHCLYLSC